MFDFKIILYHKTNLYKKNKKQKFFAFFFKLFYLRKITHLLYITDIYY